MAEMHRGMVPDTFQVHTSRTHARTHARALRLLMSAPRRAVCALLCPHPSPYFHSTAPRCQDNRQFFCHFNWLVRHTPHTYTSPSLSPSLRHPPSTAVDTIGPVSGQGVTYCRTRVIPLDDETYFTGTDASNDADGDGRADPYPYHDHTDASTETSGAAAGEPKRRGLLKPWWDWLTGLGRPNAAERRRINMDWDGCLHKPPPQTATAAAAAAAAAMASHGSVDRQAE